MRFKVHHCTKFHGEPLLSYGNLTFYFQNGIYHFAKIQIFNWVQFRGPLCDTCKILLRSVKPLLFQNVGRLPSCICCVHVRTINEEDLVVFITVQNLIGIDEVVLKTWQL